MLETRYQPTDPTLEAQLSDWRAANKVPRARPLWCTISVWSAKFLVLVVLFASVPISFLMFAFTGAFVPMVANALAITLWIIYLFYSASR